MFRRTDGGWETETKLGAEDGDPMDVFGSAVCVVEDTAVVGVLGDGWGDDGHAGSSHHYQRTADGWIHESTSLAVDGGDNDVFGAPVALTAERALVGVVYDEDPHGEFAGSAYVFDL